MEAVRRFRRLSAALAAVLTVALTVAGYFMEPAIGVGILLGGSAGIATFWMLALRLEQFAQTQSEKLQSATFRWALMRLVVYACALGLAFQLDDKQHGFIAAALGIFIIRLVAIFLGATGLDQPREGK